LKGEREKARDRRRREEKNGTEKEGTYNGRVRRGREV
jgi:hypothetical protein